MSEAIRQSEEQPMRTKFTEFKAAVATTSSRPSKTRLAHDEPVAAQAADTPTLYHGFEGQYIDGSWRPGKHGGVQVDTDPYSGETLVETIMANQTDLDEIVDWLIRESVSTRIKAQLEWQFMRALTLEAASFPYRTGGRILPLDEAGKDSRAFRQPLGVIGVISPWNFPMYL
jgi:aldehyde dehydrogenase (NAD+)